MVRGYYRPLRGQVVQKRCGVIILIFKVSSNLFHIDFLATLRALTRVTFGSGTLFSILHASVHISVWGLRGEANLEFMFTFFVVTGVFSYHLVVWLLLAVNRGDIGFGAEREPFAPVRRDGHQTLDLLAVVFGLGLIHQDNDFIVNP